MANDKQNLIKDSSGKIPIPQYKDSTTGSMKPHKGNHAPFYQLIDNEGLVVGKLNPFPTKEIGSNELFANVINVTTSNTPLRLPNIPCTQILITAKEENAGVVYIGGSNVSNTVYGLKLHPEGNISLPISNANLVYIYANAGDGISYIAI